ncbi:MAG: aminomethyl-transferring glycine dehydrogenase subunit GcvPB, partial [Bacillota bacterium]
MNEEREVMDQKVVEPLIFELSSPGRRGFRLGELDVPEEPLESLIPQSALREGEVGLPEVAEVDTVRHFVNLSQMNHGVDTGFYPLGSCTMKYNPKINEDVSRLPGFATLHPYQPDETVQGALKLLYETEKYLCEIAGMKRATLQPAAGAHGEITGIMLIRAYHEDRGEDRAAELVRRAPAAPVQLAGQGPAVEGDGGGDVG